MKFTIADHNGRFAYEAAAVLAAWARSPAGEGTRTVSTDVAEQVTDLVVGTAEDRMGPELNRDGIASVRKAVADCVRAQQPIGLHVMWGGLKHYVDLDCQDVDAAELFAVVQFLRLDRCIRHVYAPGIAVCFYLEDFGVIYEDAGGRGPEVGAKVGAAVERYCSRFGDLVGTLAGGFAVCRRFAHICPMADWSELRSRADANLAVFRHAWVAAGRDENAASDILRAIGWDGGLPATMRVHYRDRLDNLYPEAAPSERVDRLLRYFAMVALYQQTGVYRPKTPSIKFSMYLPAPGIPARRLHERLHMRTLSHRFCSQTMPPWTSLGCFLLREDGSPVMKTRSRRLLSERQVESRSIQIEIEGEGGTCAVLSHVLIDRRVSGEAT